MNFLRSTSPKYNWLHEKASASADYAQSTEGYDSDTVAGSDDYQSRSKRGSNSLTLSLVLNGSLLLLVAVLLWRDVRGHARNPKLLPTPVPEFSNEIRTFKLDPLFLSLPSPESNDAWEALPGPNGRGFININPNLGLNLPDKKAGLSVFHQLHCLGALRNFTWELMYDRIDREALLKTWPTNVTSPTYDQAINGMWHYAHCFDYLRQGIQCSGDTSLEFVHGGTGKSVVDGLDYPHVCRNWDDLWTYAKLNG